ncbi:excisionase [Azotobacter vinelandii]|uniref:excisionase n=1 Tax=Azotobacter vinelandii TaxID=354 RepID=UPI002665B257|nr:excisionase [Azotobacter vinelandii]WKN20873.1 excisionase [Azotobacter vinelandii]
MKMTLDKWAEATFNPAPNIQTIRKWVREGRIFPAPVKHGRSYYVEPDAQYIEPGTLAGRIMRDRHGTKAA